MLLTQTRLKFYLAVSLVAQVFTALIGASFIRLGYIDFRTFYTAGYMLRTGHAAQLYDYAAERYFQSTLVNPQIRALPMMSPPFTALLFAPLSLTRFWHAYFLFVAVNVLVLLLCVTLLRPFLTTLSSRWKAAPVLLFVSFLPAGLAEWMGQLSCILLLIFCACFVTLRHGRDLLAGLILSLALMKFQIALPIVLLFLLWREWRFVAGFLTGAALLTALCFRILSFRATVQYLQSLYSMTHSVTAESSAQIQFGIFPHQMPNLYGLLFVLTHGAFWSHGLILGVSLALFVWAALQRPSLPFALLIAMLISYHLFYYDLALLLLPLALLCNTAGAVSEPGTHEHRRRGLVTRISLAGLFIAAIFLPLLIYANETCWLAAPILILTLAAKDWPCLHAPERARFSGPLTPSKQART